MQLSYLFLTLFHIKTIFLVTENRAFENKYGVEKLKISVPICSVDDHRKQSFWRMLTNKVELAQAHLVWNFFFLFASFLKLSGFMWIQKFNLHGPV